MNNRQLKAILIATMCPIATPLKVQENTKKTLEDNANLILDMCGLKLDEPLCPIIPPDKKEKATK